MILRVSASDKKKEKKNENEVKEKNPQYIENSKCRSIEIFSRWTLIISLLWINISYQLL